MGRIVVSDNVSLDGVIQDPAGDEGFRVGGWVGKLKDREEINKIALDDTVRSRSLAVGPAELRVVRWAVSIPKWPFG